MSTKKILITTILSAAIVSNIMCVAYAADNIATSTVKTATAPMSKGATSDPRMAASGFVEHINYARVALAMKNGDLAKQHIAQARNLMASIKDATEEQRRISNVQSGRVTYQYDTEYKYHYFPIQTGPVEVKQVGSSMWAKSDLAVTDADIVYLTLDLTGNTAEKFLSAADTAITGGDLKEADNQLAKLTDSVVTVDSKIAVPSDKAHDNIALARNFIAVKNYDGARYALKHADDALDEMQKDETYKTHYKEIPAMRKDISDLQGYIAKKDPTMIQKANSKLDKWWKDMKSWSKSNM